MSTRCSIHIQQPDDTFKMYYHHGGGYMSGVGEAIYSIPKSRRNNVKTILKALEKRFVRPYVIGKYEDDYIYSPVVRLNILQKDPMDIEWRYRILKDGSLEVDAINTGETFKIANRKHFDFLVNHTENDLE